MGRNTWLTGTAAWTYLAATQYLLGIRPTFTGLRIAPALPASWPGFTARRVFRGVTYHIIVRRGDRPGLRVDGLSLAGDIVPFPPAGITEVQVELIL